MRAPKNKKKKFATLWVNSPFAGDVVKCMEMVKWDTVDWQDLELRKYVDLEGGKCPVELLVVDDGPIPVSDEEYLEGAIPVSLEEEQSVEQEPPPENELTDTLEGFDFPPPGAPHEEWVKLWEKLGPIYMKIGRGLEEADQAQRMVLQKIFDKVYQKEEVLDDDTVQPVVFLPVRGDLSSTYIRPFTTLTCPHCREQIEFEREDEEV